MNSLIKSYDGVKPPSFFIVEKVGFEVLPASNIKTLEVPFKSGAYFINQKYGARTFSVDFTIFADRKGDVMYNADDLAEWLHKTEPKPLIFRDKPDITYYAIVNGNVDIEKSFITGKGSIEFICYDPHGYGQEKTFTFAPTTTSPLMLSNNGNMNTAPKFEMTFTKNVTDFAVIGDREMLYFGEPVDGTYQTETDLKPILINDSGASTSGWSPALSIDGGQIMGNIVSNGYSFSQGYNNGSRDYGFVSGLWHGGSIMKSVGKEVQDFELECQIGFDSDRKAQMGRIEVYALDINGRKLAKMALKDTSRTLDAPMWDTWIGQVNSGGVSINKSYGEHYGTFSEFSGVIRMERVGKRWTFYIAKVSNGKHHTRIFKSYTDWKQKYMDKVASIQIHIGAYGSDEPCEEMWISNVYFREILPKQSNQVDYVFRKNDVLTIDCNTEEILKNGEPYFEDLYPTSSFIVMEKGANGLTVNDPSAITKGKVTFSERWL